MECVLSCNMQMQPHEVPVVPVLQDCGVVIYVKIIYTLKTHNHVSSLCHVMLSKLQIGAKHGVLTSREKIISIHLPRANGLLSGDLQTHRASRSLTTC